MPRLAKPDERAHPVPRRSNSLKWRVSNAWPWRVAGGAIGEAQSSGAIARFVRRITPGTGRTLWRSRRPLFHLRLPGCAMLSRIRSQRCRRPVLLQDANWIPSGADLIKLEKYNCGASRLLLGPSVGQTPSGRRLHPLRSRHGGGGAYLLSRKGAERVLAERGRIAMPVDHFLFNANLSEMPRILRPIIVCPGMATQYAVPYSSDTWTRGRPTRPSRWRRIWPSLRRLANELRLIPLQTAEMLFCGARLRQVAFREDPPA